MIITMDIYIITYYIILYYHHMVVSINGGTSKSSMLIGFSLINHPAIGVPPLMETTILDFFMLDFRHVLIQKNTAVRIDWALPTLDGAEAHAFFVVLLEHLPCRSGSGELGAAWDYEWFTLW